MKNIIYALVFIFATIASYYTVALFFAGIPSFAFWDISILTDSFRFWQPSNNLGVIIIKGISAFMAIGCGAGFTTIVKEEF